MIRRLFVFLLLSLIPLAAREPLDRPNVVVIFLDDAGYGDFSHNGNPVIETPVISRLAAEGVSFTQFHVTSPACSASRYSLMTGRYPGRSGFGGWVLAPQSPQHLRMEETTLADGFKSRGYATGMIGKWHLGNPNDENGMSAAAWPLAHGFDEWVGTNVSHDFPDSLLVTSDPAGSDPIPGYRTLARKLTTDKVASTSLTGRYAQAAVDFIGRHREQPFFLYLAHNQPHLALFADEKFSGRSKRGLLGDVMAEIDDSVGQILAALEKHGLASNTLLFFSSDNGPWLKYQDAADSPRYGEARLHVGYAHPFRDGKGSNFEGGHRVPGIFHWPGVLPAKRQLEPASTLDLLPTLFALAGVEAPGEIDGRDIRPLLDPQRYPGEVPLFSMLYSNAHNQPNAIREGPWKLHTRIISQIGLPKDLKASPEAPLLFQVEHDLGERIDRAAEQPEITARLLEKLRAAPETMDQ